jgi:hypothetical protein
VQGVERIVIVQEADHTASIMLLFNYFCLMTFIEFRQNGFKLNSVRFEMCPHYEYILL